MILGTIYDENGRYYKVNGKPVSYETALGHLGLQTLFKRREILTSKFAIETFTNEKHEDLFEEKKNNRASSRNKQIVQEKTCRTTRYYNSAIPYMARILNNVKF